MYFGRKYTMSNQSRWEMRGSKTGTCRLCGQYIKNDESFYLVVLGYPHTRQEPNFIVHGSEWEPFADGIDDPAVLVEKLERVTRAKPKNATTVDQNFVDAFKRVLSKKRYRIVDETSNRIYFKASKDVAKFYLNKKFQLIESTGRNNGLFDKLFLREFVSRLMEETQREMGEDVPEGFRASTVIEQAVKNVSASL